MTLSKQYEPVEVEEKWYRRWMDNNCFSSDPDQRKPYTIVIPPPNVTGVLHMGHMLNNTIQDVLVRRMRMNGFNACWVPGIDHASIATEAKVVEKLRNEGIDKFDLSRNEFLEHAWDWKNKYGGIILEQLKKLGVSCDWRRTVFTMDDSYSKSVIDTFIALFDEGLIYRGARMINWDPKAKTAISDEEVYYKETNSKLFYIDYKIDGETDKSITIATTRPETILGDTAICINPKDDRFIEYHGKFAIVPMIGRKIPIILDEYVDMEFGTGALKVTPAHDINDYELGKKHQLETIDIFNEDATLNDNAVIFVGKDRFEARELIVKDIEKNNQLRKIEEYNNKVGFSERTHVVIEPKLSKQWFLKMQEIAKPALESVLNDEIQIYPSKFKNVYKHWMENVRDWCISRQLWWGHRIPAYYLPDGSFVVAATEKEALEKAQKAYGNTITKDDLAQEEDVLDTWFSSWLWPISVFNGINEPENEQIKYYYPTNDLVTAPEILFFWVARMIMAGLKFRQQIPFKNVYLTGTVRDKKGRRMSKSLGNSPDPLDLMKIYGADGVRMGMLLCSPAGNDLLFEETLCEQGRNFTNKIWNAYRLINGWQADEQLEQPEYAKNACQLFDAVFYKNLERINDHFEKYRISDALMATYRLIWDDYCSWFLEMIKPDYQASIDKQTKEDANQFFILLMKILHPFMPFITEEFYNLIPHTEKEQFIMYSEWPKEKKADDKRYIDFEVIREFVSGLRNLRQERNISPKEKLPVKVRKPSFDELFHGDYSSLLKRMAFLENIGFIENPPEKSFVFMVRTCEFYIPSSEYMDIGEEIKRLRKDLEYQKGFLNAVEKKLSNDRFVNNAPEKVVNNEKKKKADAEEKIKIIEKQLSELDL